MAKRVTFSAVAMALTVICLYAASALSTGRLAALGLSSLFCGVCVSCYGVRYGVAQYVGASILALLFIPNRLFVLVYILFAGYYPIIKLYIEKLNRLWAEWILKVLFFNLVLTVLYIILKAFFLPMLTSVLTAVVLKYLAIIIIALEIIFILYDWILSYMIGYYHQFLRRITHE